jgi:hypothetical protein
MGMDKQTDGQTEGRTNRGTDKRTNIYSIFRDKLLLPEGSLDYKVGQKILVRNKGILCKAESRWQKDPWTITTVNMNGTIRIQCRNKKGRLNIRRVKPFEE